MTVLQFFHKCIENKISPNACYFLFSIEKDISPVLVTSNVCVEELINAEFLTFEYKDQSKIFTITKLGISFLESMTNEFKKIKPTQNKQKLLGINYKKKIEEYINLFPKQRIGNRYLRCSIENLTTSFITFFGNYNYTWEEILKATEKYLKEQSSSNYQYAKNSQYFIYKADAYKSKTSLLADYCSRLNDEEVEIPILKDKIV